MFTAKKKKNYIKNNILFKYLSLFNKYLRNNCVFYSSIFLPLYIIILTNYRSNDLFVCEIY